MAAGRQGGEMGSMDETLGHGCYKLFFLMSRE
jgi:hypothetical protein